MQVQLTPQEATFLRDHLARHLKALEDELVHTEKRDLQRSLAEETQRLRVLIDRFAS